MVGPRRCGSWGLDGGGGQRMSWYGILGEPYLPNMVCHGL